MNRIPKSENDNFLSSFWMMLGECEALADNSNDATLKTQVEGWYRQWNKLTGEKHVARWVARAQAN